MKTKNISPFKTEHWIKKGFSEEEAIEKVKEFQSRTLKKHIEKYGEEVGNIKWAAHCKSIGKALRREYYLEQANCNYDLADWLLKQRQSTFTLEKCVDRYGEDDGHAIWKERQEKWQNTLNEKSDEEKDRINKSKSQSLAANILRHGEIGGHIKHNLFRTKQRKPMIEKMIDKHGYELGIIKYNEYKIKLHNRPRRFAQGSSKESMNVFNELIAWIELNSLYSPDDLYYSNCSNRWGEYNIAYSRRSYYYDFTVLSNKLIIEYNGEHVHPNPMWQLENIEKWKTWKHVWSKHSADQVLHSDKKKMQIAQEHGFNVLVLWSSDMLQINIDKSKNFILSNLK